MSKREFNTWSTKKNLIEQEDLKLLVAKKKIILDKKQINFKALIWNLKWMLLDFTTQLQIVQQKVQLKAYQTKTIFWVIQNQFRAKRA